MKFLTGTTFFIALLIQAVTLKGQAQSTVQAGYKNKALSPGQRAADLLKRMTLDEKIMQTQCLWIQKSRILNASGDFDETKAKDVLKNGLGNWGG